jgi:hypothetical protein
MSLVNMPCTSARSAINGTRPANDTRFGLSKTAEVTGEVWKSRIDKMSF